MGSRVHALRQQTVRCITYSLHNHRYIMLKKYVCVCVCVWSPFFGEKNNILGQNVWQASEMFSYQGNIWAIIG